MNTITQTNRTILFEEINPEKLNLLTLYIEKISYNNTVKIETPCIRYFSLLM